MNLRRRNRYNRNTLLLWDAVTVLAPIALMMVAILWICSPSANP